MSENKALFWERVRINSLCGASDTWWKAFRTERDAERWVSLWLHWEAVMADPDLSVDECQKQLAGIQPKLVELCIKTLRHKPRRMRGEY